MMSALILAALLAAQDPCNPDTPPAPPAYDNSGCENWDPDCADEKEDEWRDANTADCDKRSECVDTWDEWQDANDKALCSPFPIGSPSYNACIAENAEIASTGRAACERTLKDALAENNSDYLSSLADCCLDDDLDEDLPPALLMVML
jgi:hypothetical protein